MKALGIFTLFTLLLAHAELRAQSLDELLSPKRSAPLSSSDADEAWKRVVTAFRANDTAKAVEEGNKFLAANLTPSALQLLGVKVMLGLAGGAQLGTTFESKEDQEAHKKLEEERADISQRYNALRAVVRQNDAVINEITRNRRIAVPQGSSNYFACVDASRKMDAASKELEELKGPIEKNKRAMAQLEGRANKGIKPMTLQLLDGLIDDGEIEAAMAIASTYIRTIGNDMDVAAKQQNIMRLQEASDKAVKVVELMRKETGPLMAQRKYWEANGAQERFLLKVETMTSDKDILRMVKTKMTADLSELEWHMSAAQKNSDFVRAEAQLDSAKAAQELASFQKDYPDYPGLKELGLFVAQTKIRSAEEFLSKMEADFEEIKGKIDPQKLRLRINGQRDDTAAAKSFPSEAALAAKSSSKVAILAELGVAPSDAGVIKASLQSVSVGVALLEKSQMPENLRARLEVLKTSVKSFLELVQ